MCAGADRWLHAFSVRELPKSPAERFKALFAERQRWTRDDIEPYLSVRLPRARAQAACADAPARRRAWRRLARQWTACCWRGVATARSRPRASATTPRAAHAEPRPGVQCQTAPRQLVASRESYRTRGSHAEPLPPVACCRPAQQAAHRTRAQRALRPASTERGVGAARGAMAARGQRETAQLRTNAEEQITRLMTQLSDLEELREARGARRNAAHAFEP